MQRFLRALSAVLFVLVLAPLGGMAPVAAAPQGQGSAATPIVIGVDHLDLANQQPAKHRVFEYTDFFTRSVTVHTGDVVDFHLAPAAFHRIGLGPSDAAARAAYPVRLIDREDPVPARSTGLPKFIQGPGLSPIVGGSTSGGGTIGQGNSTSTCGIVQLNEHPCSFKGGTDVEESGILNGFNPQTNEPMAVDWKITVNAPPGTYSYLCWIHPGMTGTLTVANTATAATTQAQIDRQSATQLAADRDAALAAEKAADVVSFSGGGPGSRTYTVSVGVGTDWVAIDGMLPRQALHLAPGDQVRYVWQDPHNLHTVTFPAGSQQVPASFGFDCGTTYQSPPSGPPQPGAPPFRPCVDPNDKAPEVIGDTGNAPPGTVLADPTQLVDSGILIGTGFGLQPTAQRWSVVVNSASKAGTYTYECTVHDWMQGTLTIAAAAAPVAQVPQIPAAMPSTGGGGGALLPWAGLAGLGLLLGGLGAGRLYHRRAGFPTGWRPRPWAR